MLEPLDVFVLISNPPDFNAWPDEQQIRRYERVLEWHDYIREVHDRGQAPWVWGSHQLLSAVNLTGSLGVLVAVYHVESLAEFDRLLDDDPLRDISEYLIFPLAPLFEDRETDFKRLDTARRQLLDGKAASSRVAYETYRTLWRDAPDFVDNVEYRRPPNPPVDLQRTAQPDDPIEVLLYGSNPDELITDWIDARKVIHYEKVQWWHDYAAMLIERGNLTHGWSGHQFCAIDRRAAVSAPVPAVIAAPTYDEFDALYKLDPLRDATLFLSVVLKPIADQRASDMTRLERARARIR